MRNTAHASTATPERKGNLTPPVRLYTADEVAEMLQVTASWLKEKARLREIPFTMPGGSYRWTGEHVVFIAAKYEVAPTGTPSATVTPSAARRTRKASTPPGVTALRARKPARLRRAAGDGHG